MAKKENRILITGGAGFIGSEFVRQSIALGHKVSVIDKLTYAGDLARLRSVQKQIDFYKADICNASKISSIIKKVKPQIIIHFAAETHVDRSILDAQPFIDTNVTGTQTLINLSLKHKIQKFIHISTDEVYGEIPSGKFNEKTPLKPGNPYSASKAAADLLILAAVRTFKFPATIIRPSNNYGPWQYPEKLVPVIILKALKGQKVPVYGRGQHVREWLYVSDCVSGIFHVMKKGKVGEIYNLGSSIERPNIETVKTILSVLRKPASMIRFVKDRPGHDVRYSLNSSKIRQIGWRPETGFRSGIVQTTSWNIENILWLESKLKSLKTYWKKVYKNSP